MPADTLIDINDSNFATLLGTSQLPLLVDFTAAWCPPCRAIAPHVEGIADKYQGRLLVGQCDVESNPELATRYDVRSMPTLLLFKGGQVVGQLVGAVPRHRIEALVDQRITG
jgi:thioredoxin 1